MPEILRDLRLTLRRLLRTPGFTLAVTATLALGIGANTAIFALIEGVLLRPLPFPEPDRLVALWQTAPGVNIKDLNASIADYVAYREEGRVFADVGMYNDRSMTVTEFAQPERVEGMTMTERMLPMLGITPVLGRNFTEKDCQNGGPEVVLISHGYWQRRFGGDPKAVGRTIRIDNAAREIVGVLPKDAWLLDRGFDIIRPLRFDRAAVRLAGYNLRAIGRLKPGVTLEQASNEVARLIEWELTAFPAPPGFNIDMLRQARLAPNLRLLKQFVLGDVGNSLWVAMATVGIVLLIACANVANLLLVRAEGRTQEYAVRSALGASRGRLAREMLLESMTLALLGGVAGVALADGALRLVLALSPAKLPRMDQIGIDGWTLAFTLAVSLVSGAIFGAIPFLRQQGLRLAEALRAGTRTSTSGRDRNLARNLLTVAQVALALVLLIGSGLMIRTFQSLREVPPGFQDAATVETMRVSVSGAAAANDEALVRLYQSVSERIAAVPGVTSTGLTNGLPMTGASSQDPIYADDRTYAPSEIPKLRRFLTVGPGYFHTMGTPLRAGREYSWTDIQNRREVVVIGENFAREYWGTPQAAIGHRIRVTPKEPWFEIVGVVGDMRHDGVENDAPSVVYWPVRNTYSMAFVMRTSRAGAEGLASELTQAVWGVNGTLPVTDTRSLKEIYDRSMARTAFTLTLLALSGGMAFVLAMIGLYAVISYAVAQRTREIGIRMALGAGHSELKLLFVRNGLVWGGIGAAVGLVAAAGLSRLMSSLLFAVKPVDPLTYGAVAAGLLAAAALASYLPARRVTRIDPVDALRAD